LIFKPRNNLYEQISNINRKYEEKYDCFEIHIYIYIIFDLFIRIDVKDIGGGEVRDGIY